MPMSIESGANITTEGVIRRIGTLRQRVILLLEIVLDCASVFLAYFCSLLLRLGGKISKVHMHEFITAIFILIGVYLLVFAAFSLYRTMWKATGIDELIRIGFASTIATIFGYAVTFFMGIQLPLTVTIAGGVLVMMLCGWSRIAYRVVRHIQGGMAFGSSWRRTMVVGAGETGAMTIRQMNEMPEMLMRPIIAIDDNPDKRRKTIRGVPIVGGRQDIPEMAIKYDIDMIVLCLPTAEEADRKEVIRLCSQTSAAIKTIPTLKELIGSEGPTKFRDIEITDLLSRPEHESDDDEIRGYLLGRCVLVTGGGGSIGSELCRQIARFMPSKLVIFDIYENCAYELSLELQRLFPDVDAVVEIGSVRDPKRLDDLFDKYKPAVVFHAAAHKHVPLMENNPAEAVKNNVFGTYNTALAALNHNVRRFILISTDKAVNPTSVMGASKRMAEYVIQYLNSLGKTRYAAVRFGNVLGSNGSVIPLFRKQIEAGGPVTVTDRNITRFFMTIPEAARLVLMAGNAAEKGEIFILDMGEPVRVDDIARTLIRLSGYRPDVDIKIEYSGLRPGEKLYEELFLDEEKPDQSGYPGIYVGKVKSPPPETIKKNIDWLLEQLDSGADMRTCFTALIETYHPNENREDSFITGGELIE